MSIVKNCDESAGTLDKSWCVPQNHLRSALSVIIASLLFFICIAFTTGGGMAWAADIRGQVAAAEVGDTILVAPFLSARGLKEEAETLTVNKSITIRGKYGLTSIQRLMLKITADQVTVEDIDFSNIILWDAGGGISYPAQYWATLVHSLLKAYNVNSLVFRNCTFRNNKMFGDGGALLTLINCKNVTFENCQFKTGEHGSNGLVLLEQSENVEFINCTFDSGTGYRGALVSIHNSSNVSFTDCTFSNGYSRGNGGAVLIDNTAGCTFEGCVFTNNEAETSGGAGRVENSEGVVFSNCTATANKSTPFSTGYDWFNRPDELYGGFGGAFSVAKSQVTFKNTFFGNNISHQGGALILGSSNVALEGCTFSANTTTGVWVASDAGRNTATVVMLALTMDIQGLIKKIATMVMTKATVPDAVVFPWDGSGKQGGHGGALYSFKTNLEVSGSVFEGNSAELSGGGGYLVSPVSAKTVNFTTTEFSGNSAQKGGGLMNLAAGTVVSDCLFRRNQADAVGGALFSAQNITVENSQFTQNTAPMGGAVTANVIDNQQTYRNCSFSDNAAGDTNSRGEGGAIYAHGSDTDGDGNPLEINDSVLEVDGCTFTQNSAQNGGGIALSHLRAVILDSDSSQNGALELGGGIYSRDAAKAYVTRCDFSDNHADVSAGAVYNSHSELHLKRDLFLTNSTNGRGGAVAGAGLDGIIKAKNSIFSRNSSGLTDGSVLFLDGSKATVINCTVTINQASSSALSANQSSILTLTNNIITGNSTVENVSVNDVNCSGCALMATYNISALAGEGNFPENIGVMVLPDAGDFHLKYDLSWGSLGAMEQGVNSAINTNLDFAGNTRIVNNDGPGGAVVDLGAYEVNHVKVTFADVYPGETAHGSVENNRYDGLPVRQWVERGSSPDYSVVNVTVDSGWEHTGWETSAHVRVTPSDPFYKGTTLYATYGPPGATFNFGRYGYYDDSGGKTKAWVTEVLDPLALPAMGNIVSYPGHTFLGWSDTAGGEVLNPMPGSISQSTTFYAVYAPGSLSLTVNSGSNGSVTTDPSGNYDFGTRFNLLDPAILSINPAAGFYHIGFSDGAGNLVNLDSLTLTADTTITAVYAARSTGSLTIITDPIRGLIDVATAVSAGFTATSASAVKKSPSGTEPVLQLINSLSHSGFTGFVAADDGNNNLTLTAQYTKSLYQVSLSVFSSVPGAAAALNRTVSIDYIAMYHFEYGDVIDISSLQLTPDQGFLFLGWVDAAGNPVTGMITISEDLELFAVFGPERCTLTLTSGANGIVELPLFQIYNSGATVSPALFSTRAEEGFVLDHWEDAAGQTINDSFVILGNRTINAVFAPVTKVLTVAVEGWGTVSSSLPGSYLQGREIPLYSSLAAPGAGQMFVGFRDENGNFVGSIRMDEDHQITAIFAEELFPLSLHVHGEGRISGDLLQWHPLGTVVDLSGIEVTAAEGYAFTGWQDSDSREITSIRMEGSESAYAMCLERNDSMSVLLMVLPVILHSIED